MAFDVGKQRELLQEIERSRNDFGITKVLLPAPGKKQIPAFFFSRQFFETNIDKMVSEALEVIAVVLNQKPVIAKLSSELNWKVTADKKQKYLTDVKYKKKSGFSQEEARETSDSIFTGIKWIFSFFLFMRYLNKMGKYPNVGTSVPDNGKKFLSDFFQELTNDRTFMSDYQFLSNTFVVKNTKSEFVDVPMESIPLYEYFTGLLQQPMDADINEWFSLRESITDYSFNFFTNLLKQKSKPVNQATLASSSMLYCFEFIQRSTRFFEKIKITLGKLLSLPPLYYIYVISQVPISLDPYHLSVLEVLTKAGDPFYFNYETPSAYLNAVNRNIEISPSPVKPEPSSSFDSSWDFSGSDQKMTCVPTKDYFFNNDLPNIREDPGNTVFWKYVEMFSKIIGSYINPGFGDSMYSTIVKNFVKITDDLAIANIGGVVVLRSISTASKDYDFLAKPFFNPGSENWIFGKITLGGGITDSRFISCDAIPAFESKYQIVNSSVFLRRLLIAYIFLRFGKRGSKVLDFVHDYLLKQSNGSLNKIIGADFKNANIGLPSSPINFLRTPSIPPLSAEESSSPSSSSSPPARGLARIKTESSPSSSRQYSRTTTGIFPEGQDW